MKKYKFCGTFVSAEGDSYQLDVYCASPFQSLFLLTADAIRSGKHYQLNNIIDEKGEKYFIDDILKANCLIGTA